MGGRAGAGPDVVGWLPAVVSLVGVLSAYTLWVFGHPYLALAAAFLGSIASLNHYLLRRHAGGVEPYWLFFLPLFLALSSFVVFRDALVVSLLLYVLVASSVIASSPVPRLESILGAVMPSDDWATAVLGAAALSGLAYLYIYGVGADPIGFWVVAGPLAEYLILRVITAGSGGGPWSTTFLHMYSATASLMFLPQPFLGAYAVLANSVKGVARGRLAPASVLGDYLIRASLLVVMNIGRIPVPSAGF